jgi:hypothetical protein
MEEVIKAQINESIDRRFRDQKLIAVETSEAIVNRVYGWAKLFAFFVGIPLALLVLGLSFAGIEKYSDFTKLINSVEGQIKPRIEQANASAGQAQQEAEEAQNKATEAKKTIENVTTQVNKQLGSAAELSKGVQSLSNRVSELESKTSQQMTASSQRVDSRVADLDKKIDAASKDIVEQQKKLASTNELVKSIFSKGTTEYFDTKANNSRTVIVPAGAGAAVYILLKDTPIVQTLEIKWRVASQPRGSYFPVKDNAIVFVWGEPLDNLKQNPLEVTYIPDPTATTESFKMLSLTDGHVFADTFRLPDIAPQPPR